MSAETGSAPWLAWKVEEDAYRSQEGRGLLGQENRFSPRASGGAQPRTPPFQPVRPQCRCLSHGGLLAAATGAKNLVEVPQQPPLLRLPPPAPAFFLLLLLDAQQSFSSTLDCIVGKQFPPGLVGGSSPASTAALPALAFLLPGGRSRC